MKKKQPKQFLVAPNRAGYASDYENKQMREEEGLTMIIYEKDDWKAHDNYLGGFVGQR